MINKLEKEKRLYQLSIPIIGITGGIATGKSSVTKFIEKNGQKVICADKIIKKIYTEKETLNFIKKEFPETIENEIINFKALRELAFSNHSVKEKLENFLHPKIEFHFLSEVSQSDQILFYDVPLLFEKNLQEFFDLIITVSTDEEIQLTRLMRRDNITKDLAKKIIDQQMSLEKKCKNSDIVIHNNGSIEELKQVVQEKIIKNLDAIFL